jgi:hypothetical protein
MTRHLHSLVFAIVVITASGSLALAEPKGSGGTSTGHDCKESCTKWCMGNDTPQERAKCLADENCESKPACPVTPKATINGTLSGTSVQQLPKASH